GLIAELETELRLVQVSAGVVREPLVDKIPVGLLGVVKEIALLSVDENKDGPVIEEGSAELSAEPVAVDFRLGGAVAAAVAGAEEINVRLAQQSVVGRKQHVVIATGADRRIIAGGMVGAAVEPGTGVIYNAVGAVDEREVLGIVAHLFLEGPAGDVGLAQPE